MWNWLKNIFKKPEVAEPLKPKPPAVVVNPTPPETTAKQVIQAELMAYAQTFVGQKETNGKNRSPILDKIIKAMGGDLGEPYCMYFQQYVVTGVCKKLGFKNPMPQGGGTQNIWKLIPSKYKSLKPIPGGWVFWQSKRSKSKGHVGMPTSGFYISTLFNTIEANTDGKGLRDGDGIWNKTRDADSAIGLNLLGFVDVAQMILDANKPAE